MSNAIAVLEARLPIVGRARRARSRVGRRPRSRRSWNPSAWRPGFLPGPLLVMGAVWLVVAYFLFRDR